MYICTCIYIYIYIFVYITLFKWHTACIFYLDYFLMQLNNPTFLNIKFLIAYLIVYIIGEIWN